MTTMHWEGLKHVRENSIFKSSNFIFDPELHCGYCVPDISNLMHRLCLAKRQHTLKLIECSRTWACLLFCANRQAVAASTRCAAEYADLHLDQHLPVSITWGSCSTSYRLDHDTVNGCRNPSVAAGEPRVYLREEANPRAGNRRVQNRLGRLA